MAHAWAIKVLRCAPPTKFFAVFPESEQYAKRSVHSRCFHVGTLKGKWLIFSVLESEHFSTTIFRGFYDSFPYCTLPSRLVLVANSIADACELPVWVGLVDLPVAIAKIRSLIAEI